MECPICLRSTTENPCECGYDFETCDRSLAATRAATIRARSARKAWRGVALLAAIPLSATLIASGITIVSIVLGLLFPLQLFLGVGWTSRGFRWQRAAQLRLERATQPAALPAARVILR